MEMQVAMPAPTISMPSGMRTNINSGSRAMLISPPMVMPNPAFLDSPTLRIRLAMTLDMTVGIPPKTITQSA